MLETIDLEHTLAQIGLEQIWQALADDSEARIGITSEDGDILWANGIAQSRHAERTGGQLIGKNVFDLVPEKVGNEMRAAKQQAVETGQPVTLDTVVGGVRNRLTYRAFPASGEHRFLVVAREMSQPLQDDSCRAHAVLHTKARDMGPLGCLTRRELEILALIGEHLPAQEIADRLGRSVKTVDWHRVSIGRKLGVKTRGELAAIAQRAGLVNQNGAHKSHDEPHP